MEPVRMDERALKETVKEEASRLHYYWARFDKHKCQERLQQNDIEDGTFILRPSGDIQIQGQNARILTLSVKKSFIGHRTKVWHFPIYASSNDGSGTNLKYWMAATQKRTSIEDLINYHRDNPLKGVNLPDPCHLIKGLDNSLYEPAETPPPMFVDPSDSSTIRTPTNTNYPQVDDSPWFSNRQPVPSPRPNRKTPEVAGASSAYDGSGLCDCGIPMSCSKLPQGWTVHRCQGRHDGMLYFMDEYGQTSWQLHPDIDKLCTSRNYLKYGRLNTSNFQQYDIEYVDTSELRDYRNYQVWNPT